VRNDDLLLSVEEARHQLTALRTDLEEKGTEPGSGEVRSILGDVLEMLEKMRAHYGLLRGILAQCSDAIFAKDQGGRYVLINPKGAAMFGKTAEEILGQDDTALFERESARRIMAIDRAVMRTGKPNTFEDTFVIRGVSITLLTTVTAWYEPRGKLRGLVGSAQDVSERNRAQRGAEDHQHRLRSLASQIVFAEESLRQSLAADLHDGLGQDIALTKMKISALRLSARAEFHEPLARIERLVEQADRSLRSITFQLGPPSLHDLGLVPALEWLAEDLSGRHGVTVRIEDEGMPLVSDDRLRVILFRAVRELLINTVTFAHAREARVRLGSADGLLRITVEDEGIGFDAAEGSDRGHGLFGIREHLRHVGGSMDIDSVPGRGTTVTLRVPLATVGSISTTSGLFTPGRLGETMKGPRRAP
jgi:PAS domain S-box-containing protein